MPARANACALTQTTCPSAYCPLAERPSLTYKLQSDPQGLGQAISLALPYASDDEPLLIILGDTLFDADISRLSNAETNILYTYKVEDPSRFGVAVTDANGNISKLVEKPQEFVSDEAIVGIYYIKDVKELKAALKHLMDNDIRTKGEFQLTDALQMMIEQGCKFQIWAARHNSAVALYFMGVSTSPWNEVIVNRDIVLLKET